MTSTHQNKSLEQRNIFENPFATCSHCQCKRIEFDQNWKKRINKQRELYQKQHFPQDYQVVCTCRISELL